MSNSKKPYRNQLASMNKSFEKIRKMSKQLERIRKNIRPIDPELFETTKKVSSKFLRHQEIYKPIIETQKIRNSIPNISVSFPNIDRSYVITIQKSAEAFLRFIPPETYKLGKRLSALPPRTREALKLMAKHGWFYDMEMPFPMLWEIERGIEKENIQEVNRALADYYTSRLDDIEEYLCTEFPMRSRFLKSAFNAHRREEYELSVPVLCAQIDGITKEISDCYLFIRDRNTRKAEVANVVNGIEENTLRYAILSPLTLNLPISASKYQRGPDFCDLNRHLVLHGESLDYDTEINSLKAISCINYIAQVLIWINEKKLDD